REEQPDLVFLDIEMPFMNGFDLLNQLDEINFSLIFTTAYDQFAVKAFKVSALDYLVKPVEDEDLIQAVQKAISNKRTTEDVAVKHLLKQVTERKLSDRIFVPTSNGLEFVESEQIVHCESDSNYTTIFLEGGAKMLISRTLKDIEDMLTADYFFRVHNSHLVNLKYVKKYVRGDGGHLELKDGSIIGVSRARKQALLDYLNL